MSTEPITHSEISDIIANKIHVPLAVLCAQLESGKPSDSAREDFRRSLQRAIADAICEAAARGVTYPYTE